MSKGAITAAAGVIFCCGVCAGAGFYVGKNASASEAEATAVAATAKRQARAEAFARSEKASRVASRQASAKRARSLGERRGTRAGKKDGEAELADRQAQEQAQQAPASGYYGGCNEPLFVDGYCPTPAEIETERNLEAYCGPGMKLPDGRIVPRPGC